VPDHRTLALTLVGLIACSEREPVASKPVAEPSSSPEKAILVTLELALVGEELRERIAARHDPSSPLVTAEALLAVHHRIAAPWHIYWQNPGDSGVRTRLSFDLTGIEFGAVVYPGPDRFVASGGQVSYGWERDAVLFVPLTTIGADARIQLRSDWLACHESCIPGHSEFAANVAELERRGDPITSAMVDRLPEPASDRLRASWTENRLRVEPLGEVRLLEFFPYAHEHASSRTISASEAAIEIEVDVTAPPETGQGVVSVELAGDTRFLELAIPRN
jgi:hypothetical protein